MHTKHEVLIDVSKVGLSFGDRVILRDVNAQIQNIMRPDCVQGQVVCFLGPSGIGKTQLSRIIAGLQAPTTGQVTLNGTPTAKGRVGMVPQQYTLFDFATVKSNLDIARKQGGTTAEQEAFYVNQFGLKDYLTMYPCQLSGGTRQRVAIVRQLLCAEHFIVMDEPFSGLDLVMKERACALITQVANLHELNTIIVVTHDVTEGMSIADTVWLMGREAGKPGATIVEQYDLASEGLCWHPHITQRSEFIDRVMLVKQRFLGVAAA
jgi:ABC-type nitrate/sulfonate/bicarbonate transport system ATPase subunit